jgi:hypothetical protein
MILLCSALFERAELAPVSLPQVTCSSPGRTTDPVTDEASLLPLTNANSTRPTTAASPSRPDRSRSYTQATAGPPVFDRPLAPRTKPPGCHRVHLDVLTLGRPAQRPSWMPSDDALFTSSSRSRSSLWIDFCRPVPRSEARFARQTTVKRSRTRSSAWITWPLTCYFLVELRGFEPLTPSMRTRCATGLRHSPLPWAHAQPATVEKSSVDRRQG